MIYQPKDNGTNELCVVTYCLVTHISCIYVFDNPVVTVIVLTVILVTRRCQFTVCTAMQIQIQGYINRNSCTYFMHTKLSTEITQFRTVGGIKTKGRKCKSEIWIGT